MKRLLLFLILAFSLQPSALVFAGYSLHVSPQIPEFVTVNGPYGPEQWPNPEGAILHANHFCKPANYSRFAAEVSRRTEVIRSDSGTMTAAEVLAICPTVLDAKYTALWSQAHNYEQRNISGVGLSILSLGVAQNKPKALAVAGWTQQLWGLYYQCKAQITLETTPDCPFDTVGAMPYSVPELSAEVWQ